jgi:hypothetical protein
MCQEWVCRKQTKQVLFSPFPFTYSFFRWVGILLYKDDRMLEKEEDGWNDC